jgi:saccharopine dehydrogenase-like NADP-dependent oxidoreductase
MNDRSASILVLGASGGLGLSICREVIRQFGADALIVGDYKAERGTATVHRLSTAAATSHGTPISFRQVDVGNFESIKRGLKGATAVIVAVAQQKPLVQMACIEAGIPCLDVTVQPAFVAQVKALDAQAKAARVGSLVLTGLYPGIAGVMAKEAATALDGVDTLDVSLCQSTHSSAGATGIADMLGLFAQPACYRVDGEVETVPGFTKNRPFRYPPPIGTKTHRLVNFVEAEFVSKALNVPNVNFWTGYEKPDFDRMLSLLNRLKILSLFNRPRWRSKLANFIAGARAKAEDETCAIVAEATGRKDGERCLARVSLLADSDYGATALGVVTMAKVLLDGAVVAHGVFHPTQLFALKPLIAAMDSDEIRLFDTVTQRFVRR